jgi:hypothetical protein
MKKLLLPLVLMSLLTACDSNVRETVAVIKEKMDITVLKSFDDVVHDPENLMLLCIDGVTYIRTIQGGITVKYQANQDGDPSAEECINR